MKNRIRRFAVFFAFVCCSAVTVFNVAQEPPPSETGPQEELIPEEEQQQKWMKAFQEAEAVFNSADQPNSILLFQELITQITEQKMKRTLSETERKMLLRSLDYLGQAFYLEGQQEESYAIFLKLIELDPNYQLDAQVVSPKIIDLVHQIRRENLGTLSVTSDPPGATIKLDGISVGVTNLPALYSLKGTHDLELSKPGFYPKKQTIEIQPGRTEKIKVMLERSSSVAYFVTYPKGVEILMKEKSLGVTAGDPAERAATAASELNLPLEEFSGEFTVADLQPGIYDITFRKPCWETSIRSITIERNDDYTYAPIVLLPSHAYMNLSADDPHASIFIDNEYVGVAPKQDVRVCSGKHVVKLKGPLGKFEQKVDLKKDQILTIAARLNPSLAFLGIVVEGEQTQPSIDSAREEVIQRLSGLNTLNFQDNSQPADPAAQEETLRQILEGLRENRSDPSRKTKIQELCTKVESDLLLVGVLPEKNEERVIRFYLLSNWSSMADFRTIRSADSERWNRFQRELEYEHPLFEKRIGADFIDTTKTEGPAIARLTLKTYTETQPLKVGDIIVKINDQVVQNTAALRAEAKKLQDREEISLTISRAGMEIAIPIKMLNSPMELQYDDASLLFNRQLVSLKKILVVSTNPLEINMANLNIALCYVHFGEYSDALEKMQQIELNRTIGVGDGTIKYRMAVCYRELGRFREAQEKLAEAIRASQNTLYSDDGPPLPREAERLQKAIE